MKRRTSKELVHHAFCESFGLFFILFISWLFFFSGDAESVIFAYSCGTLVGACVLSSVYGRKDQSVGIYHFSFQSVFIAEIITIIISYLIVIFFEGLFAAIVSFLVLSLAMYLMMAEIYFYKEHLEDQREIIAKQTRYIFN